MPRSPLPRAMVTLAALAGLTLAAGACGDDGSAAGASGTSAPGAGATGQRPEVVFAAGGPSVDVPEDVPGGLVDIRIQATDGGAAHLAIVRLDEDVTYERFEASGGDGLELGTMVGGNGTIVSGEETLLTVDLEPGDYSAVNIHFPDPAGPPQFAYDRFSVSGEGAGAGAAEPEADGTITLGPGMHIDVPDGFTGSGTWRFENADQQQTHEAALVRLTDGTTAQDLIQWFHTQQGPPPIAAELGAMGALGPGREAWMTLDALEPGDYALVCFVPGADGMPHLSNGMVAGFTVGA